MIEKLPAPFNIAAVVPCYGSQGDNTIILTIEGERIITRVRMRTILRHLAAKQATDLSALKKLMTSTTGQAIMQPLPFNAHLVLFPVKIRKPRIAGDISIGYVNLYAITAISKNKKLGTTINLSGGSKISTLWTISTVTKYMQFACLATAYRSVSTFSADSIVPIARKLAEVIRETLVFETVLLLRNISIPHATHIDPLKKITRL